MITQVAQESMKDQLKTRFQRNTRQRFLCRRSVGSAPTRDLRVKLGLCVRSVSLCGFPALNRPSCCRQRRLVLSAVLHAMVNQWPPTPTRDVIFLSCWFIWDFRPMH